MLSMESNESKAGYARTDRAMLCARCTAGRVIESAQSQQGSVGNG